MNSVCHFTCLELEKKILKTNFDQFDLVHVILVGKSNEIHNLCSLNPKRCNILSSKSIRNVICKRLKNVQFLIYEGQRQTTTDKKPTAKGYLSDLSDLKSELHKLVDICVYKYLLNI